MSIKEQRDAALTRIEQGISRAEDYPNDAARVWCAQLHTVLALVELGRILAGIEESLDTANLLAERALGGKR